MRYELAQHPVTKDFLYMTKYTTPYGTESETFDKVLLDRGFIQDEMGNYFGTIGQSDTLFVAHMDTADRKRERVRRVVKGDFIGTDGHTVLGADDKAGCAVLLHMWREQVPGNYLFVVGEEVGRVGSEAVAEYMDDYTYLRAIQWDRFGYNSVITHQMGERGCSVRFTNALIEQYHGLGVNLEEDDGGSYTDTMSFFPYIPECTNISVGYFMQHTTKETQDADFLVKMAEASVLVDWESLPTAQDIHVREDLYTRFRYNPTKMGTYYYEGTTDKDPWDTDEPEVLTEWMAIDEVKMAAETGELRFGDVQAFIEHNPLDAAYLLHGYLTGGNL